MSITDVIIKTVMEKVGLEQSHIDKAKEVIDMIDFTLEDGTEVILINIGDNIQIKIKK